MNQDLAALVPVFVVLALLMAACLCWCLLGSCLGAPILESLKELWEYLVLSARANGDRTLQSRRRAAQGRFSEVEEWEMNYRGSRTY
ncbi:hypothetical protein MSAN_02227900 [Mycena sanguinolenta]|uniref:Uncharacterized protein n=1 Tax=Mycena sanguinolenta TaxID=230812 RepID=A0A8H6XBK9_9AGAR|nr:hypothetical protein MSAN_02227900 [Mycena sanguinolenta]